MKSIKLVAVLAVLSVVGGCAVVPVGPAYGGGPGYYGAPAYYGPSIGIGFHSGGHGRHY